MLELGETPSLPREMLKRFAGKWQRNRAARFPEYRAVGVFVGVLNMFRSGENE